MNQKSILYFIFVMNLISCLILVSSARADGNSTFNPSEDLTRLNYYPHWHRFTIAPDYRFSIKDSVSRVGSYNETAYQIANIALSYGVLERFYIGVSEQDLFSKNGTLRNSTTNALSSALLTEGFSDPDFTFNYQVLDRRFASKRAALSSTLSLSISPSWIGGKSPSANNNGNFQIGSNGKGYLLWSVSSASTWIKGANDLLFSVSFFGRQTGSVAYLDNSGNAYLSGSDPTHYVSSEVTDRYHLNDDFYLQLTCDMNFPYVIVTTNDANLGTDVTSHSPFFLTPSLMLGWRAAPHFTVEGFFAYTNETVSSVSEAGVGSTAHTIDKNGSIHFKFEI